MQWHLPIRVRITYIKPPDVTVRAWREGMRAAHAEAARVWHEEMLPDHFTPFARFKYQYQPRTLATRKRKKQLAEKGQVLEGGLVDNVWSGTMRNLLTGAASIRAYPSRFTVTMPGPPYISMRPNPVGRSANQPDKAAEILKITPDQRLQLARVVDSVAKQHFKKIPDSKQTVNA